MRERRIKGIPKPRRKPVPKYVKKFLLSGEQTRLSKNIRAFARQFPGRSLETVNAMINALIKFHRKRMGLPEMKGVYAKRTAEQILTDKYIAVVKGAEAGHASFAAIEGCVDYNVALCAMLRAKRIPAKFVREGIHSMTHFYVEGKWYEADPTSGLARIIAERLAIRGKIIAASKLNFLIKPIGPGRMHSIQMGKKLGTFAEGLDAWSIGIRSLENFDKYKKPNT